MNLLTTAVSFNSTHITVVHRSDFQGDAELQIHLPFARFSVTVPASTLVCLARHLVSLAGENIHAPRP